MVVPWSMLALVTVMVLVIGSEKELVEDGDGELYRVKLLGLLDSTTSSSGLEAMLGGCMRLSSPSLGTVGRLLPPLAFAC